MIWVSACPWFFSAGFLPYKLHCVSSFLGVMGGDRECNILPLTANILPRLPRLMSEWLQELLKQVDKFNLNMYVELFDSLHWMEQYPVAGVGFLKLASHVFLLGTTSVWARVMTGTTLGCSDFRCQAFSLELSGK